MLRSVTSVFPTELMMKSKFYFIGRILQLLEVQCDTLPVTLKLNFNIGLSCKSRGVIVFFCFRTLQFGIRAEGIKELFGTSIPGFRGDLGFGDFQAIYNVVRRHFKP